MISLTIAVCDVYNYAVKVFSYSMFMIRLKSIMLLNSPIILSGNSF